MEDEDNLKDVEIVNCSIEVTYPTLPHPFCVVDSNTDEIVVAILIILLVIYTFYRLLHVWAYTLNFSEVNIIRMLK